jgi:type II secretory pathway component PulF
VLPKYETIFKDFQVSLPPATKALLETARSWTALSLPAAVLLCFVWMGTRLWSMIYPPSSWSMSRALFDRVIWVTPFFHTVARDRGLADALDLVADATRGGASAQAAVGEAAKLRVNDVLQGRLELWAELLEAGESLHAGAKRSRMPGLVVEMLSAVRGPETPDVLAFLARYYAGRFSRGAALLSAAAMPVLVLIFATLVAWVALAMITPMTVLINNLSSGGGAWKWL